MQEAVEQCERLWAPQLTGLCAAADWWAKPDQNDLRLIAVTREAGTLRLAELLAIQSFKDRSIWLSIGPEGGWSDQELAAAQAAGWLFVSLGDTILRTSTAAVAAASSLTNWRTLSC